MLRRLMAWTNAARIRPYGNVLALVGAITFAMRQVLAAGSPP